MSDSPILGTTERARHNQPPFLTAPPIACPKGCETRDEPQLIGFSLPMKPGGVEFSRYLCDCCGHEWTVKHSTDGPSMR